MTMLSALDLALRIEDGSLTPVGALNLCAERIAEREADLQAFAALDLARTRAEAERDGARLAASPLRGLAVGIKDIFDTVDFPTACGSPIYRGRQPASDAAVVTMVRRAGGLIPGKTVSTEFAYLQPAKTRNPHSREHAPGGSSSGSAAAVGAGMLPIAIGSQTGGSTVRPAAFCGVAGYKPSYKIVPTVGAKCLSWSLDTVGLFAAGVADVAFAAAAITGRDLRVDQAAPAAPRIALVRTKAWDEADADMQRAFEGAARAAVAAGATVIDIDLPAAVVEADAAHGLISRYEAWRALAFEYDNHRDRLGSVLREHLDEAATVTADQYDAARRTAKRARQAFADMMADADVVLTLSAPGVAPRGLTSTGSPTFNRLWTLLGTPCLNVPGCRNADGLPLGLQIVGRFGRDRAALEAGAFLERAIAGMNNDSLSSIKMLAAG
jgi:Asp-tRNA(Asn)/Glu-tRNA(Gln) amidotransferase A subunit family amidase